MLLERTLSTLQALGNERLQLPIFYESPLSLRFEIGPEDIPVNDPRYFRMAYWRTSFLYEKAPDFDTLLWVLYRTPDMDSDINELLDRFCKLARLPFHIPHQKPHPFCVLQSVQVPVCLL